MFGFFQNAEKTLREGVEAKVNYTWDRWIVSANYTFINAIYDTNLTLQSPNNPFANADGLIFVIPGDHIPRIPNQRFELSAEYQITDAWKLGGDLLAAAIIRVKMAARLNGKKGAICGPLAV